MNAKKCVPLNFRMRIQYIDAVALLAVMLDNRREEAKISPYSSIRTLVGSEISSSSTNILMKYSAWD